MWIRKAVINEQAFVSLIASVIEVWDKEVYGLLVGTIYRTRIIIKNAIPYQRATRGRWETSVWPCHEKKMMHLLSHIPGYSVLGDYHSHSYYPNALSDDDKKYMIEEGDRFALLITLEPAKKKIKWKYYPRDRCLKGTLNGFLFQIKVYYRKYQTKRVRKLAISCPYIKKLNKDL